MADHRKADQGLTMFAGPTLNRRTLLQHAAAAGVSSRMLGVLLAGGGAVIVPARFSAAQERGGTMTFAVTTDPETLDPHVTSNPAASSVFDYIYSTLIYQDFDLTYKGLLAESWETSPDNLKITFKLRPGITFHDGSPFDAESVKFTFERLKQVGTKSPIFEEIQRVTAMDVVDAQTIALTFSEPSATFFHAINTPYGGMLSRAAVEKAGDNYGRTPVGTGGYTFKEWQTGTLLTLGAFNDYKAVPAYYKNQGPPYIENLAFKVIPEASSQIASLEAGEIDSAALTATDISRFVDDDRFQIFTSQVTGISYLGMTSTKPPFDNVTVRNAVAHAVDREEIVNVVFEGELAVPVRTALPPSIPGYNPELEALAPKLDIDRAKALLVEAGFQENNDGIMERDGQPFRPVLYTSTSATHGQVATLLQAQLRKAGIDVQIQQMEVGALLDFTPKGEHDMLLLGYSWGEPNALYLFLSSDRLKSSNRVHFSNEKFDQLLKQGQQTLDFEQRLPIYTEAQKLLIEQQPWVPLYMPLAKTAVASRIQGAAVHPLGDLLLNDAFVE